MEDSDGPVIARAVYGQLTRTLVGFPLFVERISKMAIDDKAESLAEWGLSLEESEEIVRWGVQGATARSLAYTVDSLTRELRSRGAPAEQWATFVHIGV